MTKESKSTIQDLIKLLRRSKVTNFEIYHVVEKTFDPDGDYLFAAALQMTGETRDSIKSYYEAYISDPLYCSKGKSWLYWLIVKNFATVDWANVRDFYDVRCNMEYKNAEELPFFYERCYKNALDLMLA